MAGRLPTRSRLASITTALMLVAAGAVATLTLLAPAQGAPVDLAAAIIPAGWSEQQLLAQLLMVGADFANPRASTSIVNMGAGGLVFFGNPPAGSGPSLSAQLASLRAQASVLPFLSTDEEGGGVARLSQLVGALPWPRQMAAQWSPDMVTSQLQAVAGSMRALGLNMDLAPVLDTASSTDPVDSEALRSFSESGSTAATYGLAYLRGLSASGIVGVVKHFPGLGHANADTDNGPATDPTLAALAGDDLVPFRQAIAAGAPVVMMSNVTVPDWGPTPASINPSAYQYLRGLGFSGMILTDSLDAGAVSATGRGGPQAAVAAIEAGADMAMITNASEFPAALSALQSAVSAGQLSMSQVTASVARILAVKGSSVAPPPSVGRKSDGSLEVFATTGSGHLLTSWQSGPGQPLGGWLDLGLPAMSIGTPAVATQPNGGLQLFVHTTDNRLLTSWQAGPTSPFGGWLDLGLDGSFIADPAAARGGSGGISILAAATGGRLLTSWQSGPGQPFGGWLDLGLPATSVGTPAGATQPNGGLQVFVHTTDKRLLTSWQAGPTSPFGGWLDLGLDGAFSADSAAALGGSGGISVFAPATGGRLLTSWQRGPGQPFGGWLDLGLPAALAGTPAAAAESNGGLQVFAHTTDNRLLTSWQEGPTAGFGGWLDLGDDGAIGSDPATGAGGNGAIQVFVRSLSGSVLTAGQNMPGAPFGGFSDLQAPF